MFPPDAESPLHSGAAAGHIPEASLGAASAVPSQARRATVPSQRPARRIAPPKSSFDRSGAPHSSHSTWNADGSRASHDGHRASNVVAHWGQLVGRASS